ncbi:MAG: 2-hydroxyacid dehydrogenase [Actinomycetes bacterium]
MIWTQWDDLTFPDSLEHLPTDGNAPTQEDLEKITFYVPKYMGGPAAIEFMTRMPNLKVVQLPNAGYDDALKVLPSGVTLCNARGVHDASTAELAVGLAIGARRGFPTFFHNQQAGKWVHQRRTSLADSRIGILGFGSIGQLIAKMLAPHNVEIIPFTRSGSDGSTTMSEFDALLPTLDIVIIIMPLTDENHHFFDADRLARMKDGSVLINVARGPIIDTDALIVELQSGRISAGLDVTDPEPLPEGHPLWSAPHLLITPHVGGDSTAFEPRGRKLVEEQLARYAKGEPLINIVVHP